MDRPEVSSRKLLALLAALGVTIIAIAADAQTVVRTPPPRSPPLPPPILVAPNGDNLPYERPDHFPAEAAVLNDPGSWVTSSDYPPNALRERREGRVGIEATVSNYGRVMDCRVIGSSGSGDLDETACTMVTRRARFRPAYDSEGRATQGTYRTRVVWQLPQLPQIETFSAEFEFDVERDGTMSNCKVVSMQGGVPPGVLTNNPCTQPVRYKPPTDAHGAPTRRHVRLTYGGEGRDIP